MPEAVEVRRFADMIRKHTQSRQITGIDILGGRYKKHGAFEGFTALQDHLPLVVDEVNTKGKLTYLTLKDISGQHTFWLLATLGLSGGWAYTRHPEGPHALQNFEIPEVLEYIGAKTLKEWKQRTLDHLNVEFKLDDGSALFFFDSLSFGTLKATAIRNILDKKLKELGPDILDESVKLEDFIRQIRKHTLEAKPIGNVLPNQKIISGVGNYLRADALWVAKISPFRKVRDINDSEMADLFHALMSLVYGDYNYAKGEQLGYLNKTTKLPRYYKRDFWVYRQTSDINGHPVKKEELYEGSQKRSIYWCPIIQR